MPILPDDVQLDGAAQAAGVPTTGTILPNDFKLDSVAAHHDADDGSAWDNFTTGLKRIPGAIIGTPHMLAHVADWAAAKTRNAISGTNYSGADADAINPITKHLPTAAGTDAIVFDALGEDPNDAYQPRTTAGQIGQAATTALGGGLIDPLAEASAVPRLGAALKAGIAGGAGETAHIAYPNSDLAPIVGAIAAHGGSSAATAAARTTAPVLAEAGSQVFTPSRAGNRAAAITLGNDGSGITLPNPADAAVDSARQDVQSATGAIGPGLEPWQAGAQLRTDLQNRVNTQQGIRDNVTAPIRDARDASTAPVNLDPVLALIADKKRTLAGDQLAGVNGALGDISFPSGTPKTGADMLAGSRQAINSRISAATRAGDNATAGHLMDIRQALDDQVNAAVPEAGQYNSEFARLSRPLDPTQHGSVAKVLDRDQFNSRYTFPDERIPDLFLKSQATKADLDQLTASFGGDRATAQAALEQHLAGKVQQAISPDGTLSRPAFEKAVQPYQRALIWFPELAKKFANATAAQGTFDTLSAQKQLAGDIQQGALRDSGGAITSQSVTNYLRTNKDVIGKALPFGATNRLEQLATALEEPHGEVASTIVDNAVPVGIGLGTGGAEGGLLGKIIGEPIQKGLLGPLNAKRQAAFNTAIERAVMDPDYAKQLTASIKTARPLMSPNDALKQAVFASLPATAATTPGQ